MPAVTRIGDADVPHCSGMTRAGGSSNVFCNGIGISRSGDNNTNHRLPPNRPPCPRTPPHRQRFEHGVRERARLRSRGRFDFGVYQRGRRFAERRRRLDVSPRSPTNDVPNIGWGNAVSRREFQLHDAAARPRGPDFENLLLLQLGRAAPRALLKFVARHPRRNVPPLLHHVSRVVGVRPEEQVRRVHARRIVAAMADEQAGRNDSVGKFP